MSTVGKEQIIFDKRDAMSRVQDWEFILSLLQMAIESREFNIRHYKDAFLESDYQGLAGLSHALMGVSSNLSLKAIYAVAGRLDQAVKQEDKNNISMEIVNLKDEIDRFREWLKTIR